MERQWVIKESCAVGAEGPRGVPPPPETPGRIPGQIPGRIPGRIPGQIPAETPRNPAKTRPENPKKKFFPHRW